MAESVPHKPHDDASCPCARCELAPCMATWSWATARVGKLCPHGYAWCCPRGARA